MSERLKLERVKPIGKHKVIGSAQLRDGTRSGFMETEIDTYPEETRKLGARVRDERVKLRLNLRQGAEALGFESVITMSELERGHYLFDEHEAVRMLHRWCAKPGCT